MGTPAITNLLATPRAAQLFADNTPTGLSGRQSPAHVQVLLPGRPPKWVPSVVLNWQAIDLPMDGNDKTATLVVKALDANDAEVAAELGLNVGEVPTFGDVLATLSAGRVIKIVQVLGKRDQIVLFQGYPMPITMQWDPRSQSMSVTCLCEGQEGLRHGVGQQISGRTLRYRPLEDWDADNLDGRLVTALPCIFNNRGKPNRSAGPDGRGWPMPAAGGAGGQRISLFTTDNAPGASYWSYADALRYVCYFYVLTAGQPVDVADFMLDTVDLEGVAPMPDSSDPFVRRITARCDDDVAIQATSAEDGIAVLCERAGLHFAIETQSLGGGGVVEHKLRVFGVREKLRDTVDDARKMRSPQRYDLPRDRPHEDYAGAGWTPRDIAEFNKAQGSTITLDPRAINRAQFLGGYVDYEVTVLLRPGWIPHPWLDDLMNDLNPAEDETQIGRGKEFWENEFPYGSVPSDVKSKFDPTHVDHHEVAGVFRRWIFRDDPLIDSRSYDPEADPGDADFSPEGLGRAGGPFTWQRYSLYANPESAGQDGQFGGLAYGDVVWGAGLPRSVVDGWAPRRRPFRDTIGRQNRATSNRLPIVRIHFGVRPRDAEGFAIPGQPPTTEVPAQDDPYWIEVTGELEFDAERAAVRFTHKNIFNVTPFENPEEIDETAMEAYMRRHFWVSVTATVRDDRRMSFAPQVPGAAAGRERAQIVDLGYERFVLRRRRMFTSHLNELPVDEAEFEDRDDRDAFERFCTRHAESLALGQTAGSVSIFYLDQTYFPGDAFTGIYGLGVAFHRYPHVERVRLLNIEGHQRTELVLTDTRHAPEVGV